MERKSVQKAHEITDAKIQFVSLVDRAANAHTFLITKQEDGSASFTTYGRIVKADPDTHYVTGIVYEPMTEDLQGDFMSEAEIEKACYWFMKNGDKVDLQHSFDPLGNVSVVENWVEKADTQIEGQDIKKGTWLMTVEVKDDEIWDGIQKGDITGFSMGGQGTYSEEDIDLSTVEKNENTGTTEKKGLLKMLGDALGIKVVEKGEVAELFEERSKSDMFWNAFDALEDSLRSWNYMTDEPEYETNEEKITEALSEFGDIITEILTSDEPIIKQVMDSRPVRKAEPAMSPDEQSTLQGIYDSIGNLLKSYDASGDEPDSDPDGNKISKEEDTDMTRTEVEGIVQEAVEKAVSALTDQQPAEPVEKDEAVTAESIQQMVNDAVAKAAQPQDEQLTLEQVQEIVTKAVDDAMQPVLASAGLPSSLNDANVEKAEKKEHYLHGIL